MRPEARCYAFQRMQSRQDNTISQIAIKPGFVWDSQTAYLFDIDGTILRSRDRIHYNSVAAGVKRVTGFEITLADVSIHGNTDTGILREACSKAGIPSDVLEPQVAAILEAMTDHVAERRKDFDLILMPGIREALDHLVRKGALLGVATGNLEAIGWIKVEAAGLREWFRFGGFSDHFPARSELIGNAAKKARDLAGPAATVCVVGDTPRDIEAARANDLSVIAVATGHYSFEELNAHQPDVCASSLADLMEFTQSSQ